MSVALYIVAEREIEGFDPFVNGKALGHVSETAMRRLCEEAGVTQLMDYCSVSNEDLEQFLDDEEELPDDLPEETWFEPAMGLRSVRGLMGLLRAKPAALRDAAAVLADLEEFEKVLMRLQQEHVRFHVAVDF